MDTVYQTAGNGVIHEVLDNEVIIANLETGIYYSIRQHGVMIWQWLVAQYTPRQIIDWLQQRYPAYRATLQHTVLAWVQELVQEGLLRATPTAPRRPRISAIDLDLRRDESQAHILNGDQCMQSIPDEISLPADFHPPCLERYDEMKALLMLDPIHEVDEQGWPSKS